MRPLPGPYSVEVDTVSRGEWYDIIQGFEDGNVYQTWSYEEMRAGRTECSHLLLRRSGRIVAAAQVRIVRLPVLGYGAAYVRWGPLWRGRDEPMETGIFSQALRAMRNEYAVRRRLVLRVYPVLFRENGEDFMAAFESEGYRLRTDLGANRTLLVDLRPPLDEIRKGLDRKWRNQLKRAEGNDLEIVEGQGDDIWTVFTGVYREMMARKNFYDPVDPEHFRAIQRALPDPLKMNVMICLSKGQVAAGVICSALGDTGIYLFGASNRLGMESKASYLLQWQALRWMKAKGLGVYDLHGINPEGNPGTYHFKSGLAGKNGRDVRFLGRFDASGSPLSRFSVQLGESVRSKLQSLRG